jgi:glycoprotein 6-alpha-L-fucosyltransferase
VIEKHGEMLFHDFRINTGLFFQTTFSFILHFFFRVLLASIRNITDVDGYQSWRETEHEKLSKLMQARINSLQNPSKPCTNVKRVTCNINKGCGYGCEIHHAMHCFHIAYALGRPMILFSGIFYY